MTYPEADRWAEFFELERDEDNEQLRASEEAKLERLREKGWPHVPFTGPEFLCEPCECGGLCDECREAA